MEICFTGDYAELQTALAEAQKRLDFTISSSGYAVAIKKIDSGLQVDKNLICYSSIPTFLRALTIYLSGDTCVQTCAFDELGVMLDSSRNAVPTLNTIKNFAFSIACMGYNQLKLYTEDTFIVQNQPYFGYMRGALTAQEIKQADEFCASIGVTLVPCIQTLAHLNQLSRYTEYNDFFDCNDILLAGDERTYKLIDDIFATLANTFTSRKVNIGMDEAQMLGLGKYLDNHGYTSRFSIMLSHLTRVLQIATKYGFKCEMWSDMFFKLLGNGYDVKPIADIPQDIIDKIPSAITLVYWDYYSLDYNRYDGMLKNHFALTKNVAFAGGCWKWSGIAPDNTYSIAANTQNIKACIHNNVKNYFTTCWGDDGAEASHFSVLPALYDISQKAFDSDNYSSFKILAGIEFDDFMNVDKINKLTENSAYNRPNPSKYMLYNDVFQGVFDSCSEGANAIYAKMLPQIQAVANRDFKFSYIFKSLAALCKVLATKAEIGINLKKAYDNNDISTLKQIAQTQLTQTIDNVKDFYACVKNQWNAENKAFGLEVQAVRLGGLIQRLQDARQTLLDYANKKIEQIDEFATPRLPFNYFNDDSDMSKINYNSWAYTVSTCKI